uniref:Lysophospholipase n=1 Tax=Phakopsora pachyrhizi TaxID=170000 RepID=A0A0S1MJI2_PHAPC
MMEVIIAADASADTISSDPRGANWPNGASMINTFIKVTQVLPKGSASFPEVPLDPKEWIAKGFNTRPTFFGCNALTTEGNGGVPLVIYIPNTPLPQFEFKTNTSTFKLRYSQNETVSFVSSAMKTASISVVENKADDEWPTCLSCAIIDRKRNRQKIQRSAVCEACLQRYCYQR